MLVLKIALSLSIRPSYRDDSFGYALSLLSQFLALSGHGPEYHIEQHIMCNEKRPMFYNVVFGCHANTCYVIFIAVILYTIYIVLVKSMYVPILRSIAS